MPIIDEQIDKLVNARVFSTIDLQNGFFHVQVDEDSQKTSFVTPSGQYEFLRAPLGIFVYHHFSAIYCACVSRINKRRNCLCLFRRLGNPSGKDDAVTKLKKVLEVAANNGLEINWEKCQLLRRVIEYLGYIIENGTIKPSPNKTLALINFPKTVKQIQSFLGLAGYFRKFIESYASIAKRYIEGRTARCN